MQLWWLCPQPGAKLREGRVTPLPASQPRLGLPGLGLVYLEDRHLVSPASRTGSVSHARGSDGLAHLNSAE